MPGAWRGVFVITLTTPVSALAPHTADAGPRITSICLMSDMLAGRNPRARGQRSQVDERSSSSTSFELLSATCPGGS